MVMKLHLEQIIPKIPSLATVKNHQDKLIHRLAVSSQLFLLLLVSLAFTKLKEANISERAKKGYDIVKHELSSNPTEKKFVQYDPTSAFETKIAEDMRERWETSDNPVHKIQDFKSMNFVQSVLEEDEQCSRQKNRHFVHVLLIKNKAFVTVTDARGNKKTGSSAGCLEGRKGRSRRSRYAAEATAEHVGRSARKMGLKSVVMKVKESTSFRKKNKVILSWREGFRGGVGDQSPIMYIHDVTQLPQTSCLIPMFCYVIVTYLQHSPLP